MTLELWVRPAESANYSLFTSTEADIFMTIPIYVYDPILASNNSGKCREFKLYLSRY